MQATEAGKDTELSTMREPTPKHASKMIIILEGTYSHATTIRCHDERATWNNRLAQPTQILAVVCSNQASRFSSIL